MKFKYVTDGVAASNPRTIDEALGYKRKIDFPYRSVASLQDALKTMNLLDMQKLAVELELRPSSDRSRLSKAIVNQYIRLHKSYGGLVDVEEKCQSSENFDPKQFE